jgi:hypothetical protein
MMLSWMELAIDCSSRFGAADSCSFPSDGACAPGEEGSGNVTSLFKCGGARLPTSIEGSRDDADSARTRLQSFECVHPAA